VKILTHSAYLTGESHISHLFYHCPKKQNSYHSLILFDSAEKSLDPPKVSQNDITVPPFPAGSPSRGDGVSPSFRTLAGTRVMDGGELLGNGFRRKICRTGLQVVVSTHSNYHFNSAAPPRSAPAMPGAASSSGGFPGKSPVVSCHSGGPGKSSKPKTPLKSEDSPP
jgi:hypothetical protein